MRYINGVNLLPSTGEFAYDTIPYLGRRITEAALTSINRYASGGPLAAIGTTTDYTTALNNLQAEFPGCKTVALVVAWFGNSADITACQIYPSTTYIGGTFQQAFGGSDLWRCSGLRPGPEIARAGRCLLPIYLDDGARRTLARAHNLWQPGHKRSPGPSIEKLRGADSQ